MNRVPSTSTKSERLQIPHARYLCDSVDDDGDAMEVDFDTFQVPAIKYKKPQRNQVQRDYCLFV